jgi:hypothetical protein
MAGLVLGCAWVCMGCFWPCLVDSEGVVDEDAASEDVSVMRLEGKRYTLSGDSEEQDVLKCHQVVKYQPSLAVASSVYVFQGP